MVRKLFISLPVLALCITGSASALNDPTRPTNPALYFGGGAANNADNITLQSILFANDRRIAVINGERVKEGDRIGSARVVKIQDSRVLLETSTGRKTLRLLPQTLKR